MHTRRYFGLHIISPTPSCPSGKQLPQVTRIEFWSLETTGILSLNIMNRLTDMCGFPKVQESVYLHHVEIDYSGNIAYAWQTHWHTQNQRHRGLSSYAYFKSCTEMKCSDDARCGGSPCRTHCCLRDMPSDCPYCGKDGLCCKALCSFFYARFFFGFGVRNT
jgi:hypothetical protein